MRKKMAVNLDTDNKEEIVKVPYCIMSVNKIHDIFFGIFIFIVLCLHLISYFCD